MTWGTASGWSAGSQVNNLNNLAAGASAVVAQITGSTAVYMDVSLRLASITPGSGPAVAIQIQQLLDDGATYSDLSTPSAVRPITTAASPHALDFTMLAIPPGTFQILLTNLTGVAFAASGNVLATRTYSPG